MHAAVLCISRSRVACTDKQEFILLRIFMDRRVPRPMERGDEARLRNPLIILGDEGQDWNPLERLTQNSHF